MPETSNDTNKESIQNLLHMGMQRARDYQWTKASEIYRQAILASPDATEPRFRMGWALWNLAEEDKPSIADIAVAYGAQALGLDTASKESRRKFQVYRQRLEEAVSYFQSVIDRDSNHARSLHYLAKSLYALDRRQEAEDAAYKAAKLDPNNANYKDFANQLGAPQPEKNIVSPIGEIVTNTWEDLVLNPKTKRELRQMQLMLEKPDLASELGVQAPTGILLKGPPGTGKTTIARILANEAKCNFVAITPADVNQMYVGESEKRVRELFAKARSHAPCIIFVDEIDALLPVRSGGMSVHSDKVVNQFLQEMDGLHPNHRVFVVGATNRPDMLDPAVRRGGRLSREIVIPLPDIEARHQLFQVCTKKANLAIDVNLIELAAKTEGYSGADIKALVNEAGLQALIRIADSSAKLERSLKMADFVVALENLS